MKKFIQAVLQRLLGFDQYLYYFSRIKSTFLRFDSKEGDFNYFLQLLQPGSNVLDIGANIGIMTSQLGKKLRNGKVYAFEPIPYNIHALKRVIHNLKLNNVVLFEYALGNENRENQMVLPVIESVKMQGLAHIVDKNIAGYGTGETFTVTQKRLDDIETLQCVKIDAVKIDVENFEYQVFLGARKLIEKNRPVIYCELWDNENRYRCFDLMKTLGYSIYVLHHGKPEPYETRKTHTQNFFFLPV